MLRYLELEQAQVRDRPVHFNMYSPTSSPHLTQELREKGERLFEAAERKVAHDRELSDRVHTARLPLEYLKVRTGLRFAIRGARYEPENHDEARRAERFFTDARDHGAGSMREGGRPIDAEIASVRGTDLVRVRGDGIEIVVAPELGGRILSLSAERFGGEWLHHAEPHEGDYPYAGGYEEYSGNQYRTPGW